MEREYPRSVKTMRSRLRTSAKERKANMLGTILLILLVLMLIGAVPIWPHSREWGYLPSGSMSLLLLIVLVLMLLGRI